MAKDTTAAIEKTALLDKKMSEVFDWSDSNIPVRNAIWNHEMEKSGQNTMKTADAVEWMLKASDDEVKKYAEENLKK